MRAPSCADGNDRQEAHAQERAGRAPRPTESRRSMFASKTAAGRRSVAACAPRVRCLAAIALAACAAALAMAAPPALAADTTIFGTDVPATPAASDRSAAQLGVRFTSSQAGEVTGVRFFKSSTNTGSHVGALWSAAGTQLASVTFTGETTSGWQTARFSSPVLIQAGTTYLATYNAPKGRYASDAGYFSNGRTKVSGPLTATGSAYENASSSTFPANTDQDSNYYVDVLFSAAAPSGPTAAFSATPSAPSVGASVTFDARSTTCPAGGCTYSWEDDGPDGPGGIQWPLGSGSVLTRSFAAVGTKWVRLNVTDAAGA